MDDKELYQTVLGLSQPWQVEEVQMDPVGLQVLVRVAHGPGQTFRCPQCERELGVYDHQPRRWRHLDTCQFQTLLEAGVPRVQCPEHGVRQVAVPWAEARSRFTALFEALVIRFAQLSPSVGKTASWFGLSWEEVDGVLGRAVQRGLAKKVAVAPTRLALDETSFQKGHDYVVVVSSQEQGIVEAVLPDRTRATLEAHYDGLPAGHLDHIASVSMDMWGPFISATRARVPGAERKICFDRFHISGHLGAGLDQVRRREQRELTAEGWGELLAGTKYEWLRNDGQTDNRSRRWFAEITRCALKTSRAWALKEMAGRLWGYAHEGWARKQWKRMIQRLLRCNLEPMVKVGRMIRTHLEGILNAIRLGVNNGQAESINACIQRIKNAACGYRNKDRFIRMILFVKGGLDLYPAGTASPVPTHTNP